MGLVDRFETDQKVLTAAPAGAAAPTGPATAPASPGASRTELIRVFYVVLYPYRAESPPERGGVVRRAALARSCIFYKIWALISS